jgi:putative endonuclease
LTGTLPYFVYIMASDRNGTLYVGVTNDLVRRVYEHKHGVVEGFTKRHDVDRLVYFETTDDVRTAIQRERNLKRWNREWKISLIERSNPDWYDLSASLVS